VTADDFPARVRRQIAAARDRARRACTAPQIRFHGPDVDAVAGLLYDAEALAADLDRLHAVKAEEYINATVGLRSMQVVDGAMTMDLAAARELTLQMVAAARGMLAGGANYSETRVDLPADADAGRADPAGAVEWTVGLAGEPDRYVIRVQRAGRITPHEARRAAEADAARWRALAASLAARLRLRAYCASHPAGLYAANCLPCLDRAAYDQWREATTEDPS
jgi:hypothetical protein